MSEQNEAALADVEQLCGTKSGTPRGDRLDVLEPLIDAYERRQYPPDPIDAITIGCSNRGWRDHEAIIGTRTRIAEVLSRRRGLSVAMILRLHEKLGITAEILIQPT